MTSISLLLLALSGIAASHGDHGALHAGEPERHARLTLHGGADESAVIEVELVPESSWSGDLFLSLSSRDYRTRTAIRPDEQGRYRQEIRLPGGGVWSVYLRYGIAQAGFAGLGGIEVPEGNETSSALLDLYNGFLQGVPAWVQWLGYLAFGFIALLAALGVTWILRRIRDAPRTGTPAPI